MSHLRKTVMWVDLKAASIHITAAESWSGPVGLTSAEPQIYLRLKPGIQSGGEACRQRRNVNSLSSKHRAVESIRSQKIPSSCPNFSSSNVLLVQRSRAAAEHFRAFLPETTLNRLRFFYQLRHDSASNTRATALPVQSRYARCNETGVSSASLRFSVSR